MPSLVTAGLGLLAVCAANEAVQGGPPQVLAHLAAQAVARILTKGAQLAGPVARRTAWPGATFRRFSSLTVCLTVPSGCIVRLGTGTPASSCLGVFQPTFSCPGACLRVCALLFPSDSNVLSRVLLGPHCRLHRRGSALLPIPEAELCVWQLAVPCCLCGCPSVQTGLLSAPDCPCSPARVLSTELANPSLP